MIPDYQSLMLPLLKLVSDRQEHKYRDLIENPAAEFQMTEEEHKEKYSFRHPISQRKLWITHQKTKQKLC